MNRHQQPWDDFIHEAVTPEPESDVLVQMLDRKLAEGWSVQQVDIVMSDKPLDVATSPGPEAQCRIDFLEPGGVPKTITLLPSPSLLRWTLRHGLRMASTDGEICRVAGLLRERLGELIADVGKDYFESLIVWRLRQLGPRQTMAMLSGTAPPPPPDTEHQRRTQARLDSILVLTAKNLRELGYPEEQVARTLDLALSRYLDGLLHISARRELFGR